MQKIGESFAQNLSNQSDLDLISNENFYFIFGIMIKDSLFSQKMKIYKGTSMGSQP
jgi:hypothetical protein